MKRISEVKHYRTQPDGSLKFVGTIKVEVDEIHTPRIPSLVWRDRADALNREREIEAFEALVDAACGE